ncbi:MAG TPA: (d)CMP kinase [Coriobacteriia bacterium]|uniref:(d)CMP kinase n=1 Tax=Anaerosoma tenue TaxID=2933588 RepID=UPI00076CB73D|nr:(d)CMP kinase [Anaerosoma tenue]KUK47944.1 MAG: Cytidylate kinase [Actinobacteria bacterium 66_15]MCK8114124.1 (d)CMP kinase [Anaerosoma tenue]HAL29701.1 (d)CMP kinase [Coriobacteriia bacterium]
MIIAIDGPAASGKSTVAKAVARRLGVRHLDTGAMYRAVTWLALERGVSTGDAEALAHMAEENPVSFEYLSDGPIADVVRIAGHDVTTAVRTPDVDANVSAVSAVPAVREALVARQRELADGREVVAEGRDIGTVVFPLAEVKVFLTASAQERARRRRIDLAGQGVEVDEAEVQARLERRDQYDSSREVSPLAAAGDATLLDTTGLTVEQVVDAIEALVEERR